MKRFAFRLDAGLEIGLGHLMRSLTLADELARQGHACHFIMREGLGYTGGHVLQCGHNLHGLPAARRAEYGAHPAPPPHAAWLGAGWQADAQATAKILAGIRPDWLVMDHYALDAEWEKVALPVGAKLLVIDDLADRPHISDVLLDQNLGRVAADYVAIVPEPCALLIGPAFALLRPAFSQLRAVSLARRSPPKLAHILVTMGGVDKDDITSGVLEVLARAALPEGVHITVVMGAQAPALAAVQQRAAGMAVPTRVLVNIDNMAEVMASADLAIGAAGSTSWERCCLGLPTLMLTLADNQAPLAEALAIGKAAINVADVRSPGWQAALTRALGALEVNTLLQLSSNARTITNGKGSAACVQVLDREQR